VSWVNELTSSLGIPTAGVTLSIAIYAACKAAEKAARPEALRDIARALKNPRWGGSTDPTLIAERVFEWTFGERHLSWRSIRSSVKASLAFCAFLTMIYTSVGGVFFLPLFDFSIYRSPMIVVQLIIGSILLALMPDYLALAKTRFLIRNLRSDLRFSSVTGLLVVTDLCASLLISGCITISTFYIANYLSMLFPSSALASVLWSSVWFVSADMDAANELVQLSQPDGEDLWDLVQIIIKDMAPFSHQHNWARSLLPVFLSSTLLTSTWTMLILVSALIIKIAPPVQRLMVWYFDLDKRPVSALGIVSGALVILTSWVWTVLWNFL
jgi:hypothetical protein